MPSRFVILEHHHEGVHYDLMLEQDGMLDSWRLPQPLQIDAPLTALASFDHRLAYLDYEGPISGDRGMVRRWDAGIYEGIIFAEKQIDVLLQGVRCVGRLQMKLVDDNAWTATFTR